MNTGRLTSEGVNGEESMAWSDGMKLMKSTVPIEVFSSTFLSLES